MGFTDRGVISDRWSSKILWLTAVGSAIGLYMVMYDRQMKNREKMMAMQAAESVSQDGE